jgi:3D (Asp-Asp-Asp) domain-containing protein
MQVLHKYTKKESIMAKIYEDQQCVHLPLNMAATGVAATEPSVIEPGTILHVESGKAIVATTGDTITAATAHEYFLANDYYANCSNGYIGAIPVLEMFEAELDLGIAVTLGEALTITNGAWGEATTTEFIVARAMETNASGATTPSRITTVVSQFAPAA